MFRTVTPILSAILAILLFIFFTEPVLNDVKSLQKDRNDYLDATAKYSEFNKKLEGLVVKKDSISASDRERLNQFLPGEIDTAALIVKLEKLAKQNGMLFGNINANDAAEKRLMTSNSTKEGASDSDALTSADVSFDVIGTYAQFKNFLKDIESSLTLLEITKISLNANGETQFQQYSMTVRSYAIPNK